MAEITSLADAVRSLVRDGQTVALEGFTHLSSLTPPATSSSARAGAT